MKNEVQTSPNNLDTQTNKFNALVLKQFLQTSKRDFRVRASGPSARKCPQKSQFFHAGGAPTCKNKIHWCLCRPNAITKNRKKKKSQKIKMRAHTDPWAAGSGRDRPPAARPPPEGSSYHRRRAPPAAAAMLLSPPPPDPRRGQLCTPRRLRLSSVNVGSVAASLPPCATGRLPPAAARPPAVATCPPSLNAKIW